MEEEWEVIGQVPTEDDEWEVISTNEDFKGIDFELLDKPVQEVAQTDYRVKEKEPGWLDSIIAIPGEAYDYASQNIPGVKQVGDTIKGAFTTVGEGMNYVDNKISGTDFHKEVIAPNIKKANQFIDQVTAPTDNTITNVLRTPGEALNAFTDPEDYANTVLEEVRQNPERYKGMTFREAMETRENRAQLGGTAETVLSLAPVSRLTKIQGVAPRAGATAGVDASSTMVGNAITGDDLDKNVITNALMGGTFSAGVDKISPTIPTPRIAKTMDAIAHLPEDTISTIRNLHNTGFINRKQAEDVAIKVRTLQQENSLTEQLADIMYTDQIASDLKKGKSLSDIGGAGMRGLDVLDDEVAKTISMGHKSKGLDDVIFDPLLDANRAKIMNEALDTSGRLAREYKTQAPVIGLTSQYVADAKGVFKPSVTKLDPEILETLGFGKTAKTSVKASNAADKALFGGSLDVMSSKNLAEDISNRLPKITDNLTSVRNDLPLVGGKAASRTHDELNTIIQGLKDEGRLFLDTPAAQKASKNLAKGFDQYSGDLLSMNSKELQKMGLSQESVAKALNKKVEDLSAREYSNFLEATAKRNEGAKIAMEELLGISKMNKQIGETTMFTLPRMAKAAGAAAAGALIPGSVPAAIAAYTGGLGAKAASSRVNKLAKRRLATLSKDADEVDALINSMPSRNKVGDASDLEMLLSTLAPQSTAAARKELEMSLGLDDVGNPSMDSEWEIPDGYETDPNFTVDSFVGKIRKGELTKEQVAVILPSLNADELIEFYALMDLPQNKDIKEIVEGTVMK